jgi:protein-tyrosine-phosphatase/phosphohistidine swiveling domain-containing protein
MADADDGFRLLVDALKKRGIDDASAEEAALSLRRNKVAVLCWDDADKERVVVHAFHLARVRSLLQRALGASANAGGDPVIQRFVAGIDEHVQLHHWPTAVDEDDPALLRALWRQHRMRRSAAGQVAGDASHAAGSSPFDSEGDRILRSLLKLPVTTSPGGTVEPVPDHALSAALRSATDRPAISVIADELQARYPTAYPFLCAVYGPRRVASLHRLIDLERVSSRGFDQSLTETATGLSQLIDNLTVAKQALGAERFESLTATWNSLDSLRMFAVLDLHSPGICMGGYRLAYRIEYSRDEMPPWIESSGLGELESEESNDAGVYVLLTDHRRTGSIEAATRNRLYRQYLDFQKNLIEPNYDALGLIVAHADKMTRWTAQTIVSLLRQMVDAYRQITSPADGDAAMGRYDTLLQDLDRSWNDLAPNDALPPPLRHRITRIGPPPPTGRDTAHSLIRFLHDNGNVALERLMRAAHAEIRATVGRLGTDETEAIQIARLDEAPIIVRGVIRHRVVAAIVRAAQWVATPVPGTFVLVRNHLSYSVRLGEHRAELSANIDAPDQEGFIRLETYQGGVDLAQQLRGAFVRTVLTEVGLAVTSHQQGLVDSVVIGLLDKDHGARTDTQIENSLIVVLRLLWSLRDLDYGMAYLFARQVAASPSKEKSQAERINEFAASLARIFLLEGRIPFSYRGEGMPFDTYCQYAGPRVHREFVEYLSEERQMTRFRLHFTLNALCRTLGLTTIRPGTTGIGQEVIDTCFNAPVRKALARGELRIGAQGRLERNPHYQPLKEMTRLVIARENEALRMAVLLKVAGLTLAFRVIGSIDRLTALCAQLELAPDEWLVIYGLADDENRTILYAFGHRLIPRGEGQWLSFAHCKRQLRNAGYRAPSKIRIPAFRKLVSHRLLVESPRARTRLIGASVRGLSVSVGDGSVRIGRITFDRTYWVRPEARAGQVLLVPFTTPEDIQGIRAAEAVLVTSGGLLSHAGVTTREFHIPSLMLPNAEWIQSPEGLTVRLEERHPGKTRKTEEGFWVSDSVVSEMVTLREGDVVLVWASQGIVSIIPMAAQRLEQAHELILQIISGHQTTADLERWLADLAIAADSQSAAQPLMAYAVAYIFAAALWDKRIDPGTRAELMQVVHRARTEAPADRQGIRLPKTTAAYVNTLVRTVLKNAFAELEQLLAEVEQRISAVTAYWRVVNILAGLERHWVQVSGLADTVGVPDRRFKVFQGRIDELRRHPRIALLRTAAFHEVESFAGRHLTEAELPEIRKTMRRLRHCVSEFKRQRVLVVCTANVDRSPMAELLLTKMLLDQGISGIDVFSRGVAAFEGRPMSEIGRMLLCTEDGIDPGMHRSRRIDTADIHGADVILAMERSHVRQLAELCPDAVDRITLLTSYGGAPELGDIDDPAGQVGDAYPRVKRLLQIALSGAVKRMSAEGLLAKAMAAHLQGKAEELTRAKRRRIGASERTVLPLEEVDADCVALVGGKGANLGEIAQIVRHHGAEVPPALMVTTFAFERFLEENGLGESFARMSAAVDALHLEGGRSDEAAHERIADASKRIHDLISAGTLDAAAGVGREITQALDAYGLRSTSLSVRSSGLQEDAEEAAFAGAAETYLGVRPAEVLHAIQDVWKSFWLVKGILYRSSRIMRQGPVKPAVVIQKMFQSQVSGVMFTTDPVSGKDVIVVEAGYGLGEGLVSGLVDVDRYYVDKSDGAVSSIHVGKKAYMVQQDPAGKGTSVVPVERDLRDVPCLKERDIRMHLALAIEDHYALSQDIEFGIAEGKFCVLQTRPITTR